jgi:hypothetical protein
VPGWALRRRENQFQACFLTHISIGIRPAFDGEVGNLTQVLFQTIKWAGPVKEKPVN